MTPVDGEGGSQGYRGRSVVNCEWRPHEAATTALPRSFVWKVRIVVSSEAPRVHCWMCEVGANAGRGVPWATHLWVYVDGTTAAVCARHMKQARDNAGGVGVPLASLRGLEVGATKATRDSIERSRPRAILDVVRDELPATIRKEMSRLQVHVQWIDQ